jgi:hypothetical protein
MRKLLSLSLVALIALTGVAIADLSVKDGAGVTRTIKNFVCETTKLCNATVLIKSDGTEIGISTAEVFVGGRGTAGTAAGGVLTVQGAASMTKLLVTPDSVALPANQSVNVAQINGVTPLMGAGATGTGSPRVTTASDSPEIALITSTNTKLDTLNTNVTAAIPAGTNLIGDVNLRQGGAALSATNGTFGNVLQGNAVLSATNGLFANVLQGNAVLSQTNPSWSKRTDGTNAQLVDPCQSQTVNSTPINISTATTTRIATESASVKVYICHLSVVTAAANNVAMIEGTGASCAGGTPAGMAGGTTAASGWNFSANGGISLGMGGYSVNQTLNQAYSVCLVTSAATQLSGVMKWVAR